LVSPCRYCPVWAMDDGSELSPEKRHRLGSGGGAPVGGEV
jgi:hypothetical protein